MLLGLLVRQSTLHSSFLSSVTSRKQPMLYTESDMTSSWEGSLCFNLIVFIMKRLTHMALGVINDLSSSPSLSPSVSMNVYLARQSRPGKSFWLRDDQPGCRQVWIPSVFPLPGQPFSWEKGFGEQQLKRQYLSSLLKKIHLQTKMH